MSIVLLVVGASMVFRFSWGMWPSGWVGALMRWCSRAWRSAKWPRTSPWAARPRERAVVVREERTESEEHHPEPVQIIEPVLVDTPRAPGW